MNAFGKGLVAFMLAVALAFVGSGVSMIVQRETGTRAQATVTRCVRHGRYTHCTGTWVVGGNLVGGGGHLVVGTIEGAVSSDVDQTIDVTVSGDRAYTRSLALPIVLIALGLPLAALFGLALIRGPARLSRATPRRGSAR